MTDWSELKEKILVDCVKRLDTLGLKYAIVRTNGEKIGILTIKETRDGKRGPNKYGRMELKNYISPLLDKMKPGDEISILCDKFEPNAVQASATAIANIRWGKGSYASTRTKDNKHILLMRMA
jgi:hypothetical protein